MNILSLNPGSSSLKFALHSVESKDQSQCLLRGNLERLGTTEAALRLAGSQDNGVAKKVGSTTLTQAVGLAIESCNRYGSVDAIGCRVVHGGSKFCRPTLIDAQVLDSIRALSPLAPLHNARDVATMVAAQGFLPDLPVVAVFDTAFHQTLPDVALHYALPKNLAEKHGLRRFGFHGISYRYVSKLLINELGARARRMVICHLGSGASMCALLDGVSIDTSMGMTPLEGLVMGTRSGDVDPGLILFLQREVGMTAPEVDSMLNSKSGLAGLSGLSGDVREIEKAASQGSASAELALEVFAYRAAKYIGAYAVALGGLDCLGFCGGIGENSDLARRLICARLQFLGIHLDEARNSAEMANDIERIDAGGPVSAWVVKTDEEREIAYETFAFIASSNLRGQPGPVLNSSDVEKPTGR